MRGDFGPAAGRFGERGGQVMRELIRSNDPVLLSAIGALLDGAGVRYLVFDQNMSVLEGSIGVLARRLLVHEEQLDEARRLLTEAGYGHELRPDA